MLYYIDSSYFYYKSINLLIKYHFIFILTNNIMYKVIQYSNLSNIYKGLKK